MAANRGERFLERQRGAGARDINLTFDLELPGIPRVSKTPLRPQKSGRSRKTPQPEALTTRSTRKTPKPAKDLSAQSTKRTPATARRRTLKAPKQAPDNGHTESVENPLSNDVLGNNEGARTNKRKALEDIPETDAVTPPKKRRKRKSIGQQSLKKKQPRQPLKPKHPNTLANETFAAEPVEDTGTDKKGPAADETAEATKPIAKAPRKVYRGKVKAVADSKPRRGKVKAIEESDNSNDRPPPSREAVPGSEVEAVEGAHETPKVEDPVAVVPEANEAKREPQKRKRKRKAVVQSPKKRKKPTPREPSVVPKEDADPMETIPNEQLSGTSVVAVPAVEKKASKRGRKPKATLDKHVDTPENLSAHPASPPTSPQNVETEAAQAEIPEVEEKQSVLPDDAALPKRKGRKRKSVGQVQRPRKKVAVKSSPGDLADVEVVQLEVKPLEGSLRADVPSGAKRRGRPKKALPPPVDAAAPVAESVPDKLLPVEGSRKRGRPKKTDMTIRVKASDAVQENPIAPEIKDVERAQEPLVANNITIKRSSGPRLSVSRAYAPTATLEPLSQLPAVTKKRGRSKKQPAPALAADSAADEADAETPITKPSHCDDKHSQASVLNASFGSELEKDRIDADTQPLSDAGPPNIAPLKPKSKGKATAERSIAKPKRREPTNIPISTPGAPADSILAQSPQEAPTRTSDEPDFSHTAPAKPKAKPQATAFTTKRTKTFDEPDPLSINEPADPSPQSKNTKRKPRPAAPSRPPNNNSIVNNTNGLPGRPATKISKPDALVRPYPNDRKLPPEEPGHQPSTRHSHRPANPPHPLTNAPVLPQRPSAPHQDHGTDDSSDLETRLAALSASVRKRKAEMGAEMTTAANNDRPSRTPALSNPIPTSTYPTNPKPKVGNERQGGGGALDGFVFSRVKAKRRKVARAGTGAEEEGEETIHPELQALLSRVRGVGGRGGVVGIF